MNKINKTRSLVSRLTAVAATGSLVAAVSVFAPQVIAADSVDMELKIKQMEESLRLMREELNSVREASRQPVERVDSLEERVTMVELSDDYVKKGKSQVFFRGGYANMNVARRNQVFSDLYADDLGNLLGPSAGNQDGWYFGAGIEHTLSEDLLGLYDGAELLGEINFQFVQFSNDDARLRVVPAAAANLSSGPAISGALGIPVGTQLNANPGFAGNSRGVALSQFTLSASPKIKFLPDSAIRPWIIPVGLDINVISPPSDAGTVLNIGINFGAGVEWNFWQNMNLGADVRYHWSPRIDGVDPRYWQAGGYVGFAF